MKTCVVLRDEEGKPIGIMCFDSKVSTCYKCGTFAERLCDFPIGKKPNGRKLDCDRPMCARCSNPGQSAGVDFCDEHIAPARAAFERRQLSLFEDQKTG